MPISSMLAAIGNLELTAIPEAFPTLSELRTFQADCSEAMLVNLLVVNLCI